MPIWFCMMQIICMMFSGFRPLYILAHAMLLINHSRSELVHQNFKTTPRDQFSKDWHDTFKLWCTLERQILTWSRWDKLCKVPSEYQCIFSPSQLSIWSLYLIDFHLENIEFFSPRPPWSPPCCFCDPKHAHYRVSGQKLNSKWRKRPIRDQIRRALWLARRVLQQKEPNELKKRQDNVLFSNSFNW